MKYLALVLTLVLGCASVPTMAFSADGGKPTEQADNSTAVFNEQLAIIVDMWAYQGLELDVQFWPCDTLNSFYSPDTKTITLCTEFAAYPKVAVFVAAHEMGHAIAVQLLRVDDEEAADEIAALWLLQTGRGESLLEAALYFQEKGGNRIGSAGHPSNLFRAWNLACLAAGYDGHPAKCVNLYKGTKARWDKRLELFLEV